MSVRVVNACGRRVGQSRWKGHNADTYSHTHIYTYINIYLKIYPTYLHPGGGHAVVVVVAGEAVVHNLLEDGDEGRHQVPIRLGVLPI